MNTQNIVIITSDQLRHRYFVNQLNACFPLSAVLVERIDYPTPISATSEESEAWQSFFIRRREFEQRTLGYGAKVSGKNNPVTSRIPIGQLNHPKTLEIIQSFDPSLIIVFGSSLFGPEYLSQYPKQILNLHLGLSQYYRGSSCNFWPIHEGRPGRLGATVLRVGVGIDDGEVVIQETIELSENDDTQTLMAKTLILGTQLMIETIINPKKIKLLNQEREKRGKLYLMKDFTPRAVLDVKHFAESGCLKRKIVEENLKRKTEKAEYPN